MLQATNNERTILLAALAGAAILVLYFAAFSPYMDWREDAVFRQEELARKVQDARDLLEARTTAESKWKEMVQPGIQNAASGAEDKIYKSIYDWASEARVNVTMLKAQRSAEKTRLPEIKFTAQGTCTMRGMKDFLVKIQSSNIPIKVTELRLDTHKEAQDDLMFKMSLSTVYLPAAPRKTGGTQ